MLRFAKPDGKPFDLSYEGDIHVFDSGNGRIAFCKQSTNGQIDEATGLTIRAIPDDWDCWEVVIATRSLQQKVLLQRSITSAWASTTLVERFVISQECAY